jgi:bacteriocin-like protein
MADNQNEKHDNSRREPQLKIEQELSEDELAQVVGGVGPSQAILFGASTPIDSPRDPQSGLPTGKRMHKPISV